MILEISYQLANPSKFFYNIKRLLVFILKNVLFQNILERDWRTKHIVDQKSRPENCLTILWSWNPFLKRANSLFSWSFIRTYDTFLFRKHACCTCGTAWHRRKWEWGLRGRSLFHSHVPGKWSLHATQSH